MLDNYVIAVLPDRTQAEAASIALAKEDVPISQITILGKGYPTADEFAFIDPKQPARRQAVLMSFWLVPFGFLGGIAFSMATQYDLFHWAGMVGNHLIGGIFGAIGGAMGSFFVGGSARLTSGEGNNMPYHNRINQGKYLVVVKGAANLNNKATRILRKCNPESVQSYVDPSRI
jgi:hypothetical protein